MTLAAPRVRRTSVKPPVEAPMSRQTRPVGSSAKASSAAASLTPPRDAQGWGASASIGASPATSSEAFLSATPPTLTSPAAIAACARARLEKKPRSTRTMSARLRMRPLTRGARLIVNENPDMDRALGSQRPRNEPPTGAFPDAGRDWAAPWTLAMIAIPYALDALNFLAADVRNLFGPFVNVFLVTGQHWSQTDVGLVTTGSGLLGIAFQTPIGAAIDVTRAKRGVIVLTMAAMTVAAAIIFVAPTFWPMALALSVLAVAGDVFAPAVSALTLGLVTRDQLARRLGRNSAFDHGGNIAIALLAGAVGYAFSQRAVVP